MKKAVIYSRVSTVNQDYASQTKDLQKEAERQGYQVTEVYEEKESGFVDDRPEPAKVLALTKAEIKRLCKDMIQINRIIAVLLQCQIFSYNSRNIL